jgi:hypothetical protein
MPESSVEAIVIRVAEKAVCAWESRSQAKRLDAGVDAGPDAFWDAFGFDLPTTAKCFLACFSPWMG